MRSVGRSIYEWVGYDRLNQSSAVKFFDALITPAAIAIEFIFRRVLFVEILMSFANRKELAFLFYG